MSEQTRYDDARPDLPTDHAATGQGESPRNPSAEHDALVEMTAERDAALDRALRTQAEWENYRRRIQREREDERRFAALPFVRDLLPSLDNLQRALDAGRHTDDLSAMLQGVEMVASQIGDVLTRHGAEPIVAVGEPFDPNRHEAIQQMASADHPPMTVIDEVERGYTLHDRVVRPSKVIVSVAPPS
ncbi:MAG: nucleotide exchange factor GrpE [Planctomycetaceae bacterium]|nr:nucleotide exchange factor GrpE [Planctomycetaceae bacterium]